MKRTIQLMIGIPIIASFLGLMFYGLFYASNPKEIPSALIQQKAKNFAFTTFEGRQLDLEAFRGKPIILNFWASWCVPCRQEAHILETAHRRFTPQGAAFIGIAINDKREDSLAFIKKYNKTYDLAPDDKLGTIALDYGVTGIPETFFINKEGIIQHKHLGLITADLLNEFLEEQLSGS